MATDLEGAHQGFVHAHHATGVVKLPAVVGSREQSHQLPLGEELIPIFYHLGASDTQESAKAFTAGWGETKISGRKELWYLVSSTDEVQIVTVEELADHVGAEREGDAAVVLPPALHVLIGVRPQQVTQKTCRGEEVKQNVRVRHHLVTWLQGNTGSLFLFLV